MSRPANVTKLFSLVVILHLVATSHGADLSQSEANNNASGRTIQNISEIGNRLLQIRSLLKQLFWDWKAGAEADERVDAAGESEIEGKMINIYNLITFRKFFFLFSYYVFSSIPLQFTFCERVVIPPKKKTLKSHSHVHVDVRLTLLPRLFFEFIGN